ncbi:MAG: carbohydrate ABC transporter substrate-binding protein, partial [Actinobacteria bacterium]|nr:carbohydrate ABC transporter substrate-binding protein [Actinomycetota bacterium]
MRKSTYKFVAGLFAIALLAAGCSSSSDEAATEETATEESAAPAAADPELEIFTWWAAGGEAAGLAGLEAEFTANNPDTK